MKHTRNTLCLAALVALLLLAPLPARAADMTVSDEGLELIKRYENFVPTRFYDAGSWFIGYSTLIGENEYVNAEIDRDEADRLLKGELKTHEKALNAFISQNSLSINQAQFDALLSFTYNTGSSWMNGSSDLLKIVRGDLAVGRRETFRAFGIWSHAGGAVLPGLAERRMEEAALYMDGSVEGAKYYTYLAIKKDDKGSYETDFAVYEKGDFYDKFPNIVRLGYRIDGMRLEDGSMIRLGDRVEQSVFATVEWVKNTYDGLQYGDVSDKSWYYDYVMDLSERKVVGGRQGGMYDPNDSVTTAEAVKLLLLAAGEESQPGSEAHWADGYLRLARERELLPEELLDLPDQSLTRRNVARLAARVLGFGRSYNENPFSDVNDGYATALSEAGIMAGSKDAEGTVVFKPDDSITRAEVAAVVWRVSNASLFGKKQTVRYGSRDLNVTQGVPFNSYDPAGFSGSGKTMTYSEPGVTVRRGLDVSRHQGDINWSTIKQQGFDFAILRVGGRYQSSGEIYDDVKFEEYYRDAIAAGLQIGVYFYSQAISTQEAVEEARFVLSKLSGKTIEGPVVFDWESAGYDTARTAKTPSSTITSCAIAYCDCVKAAGYQPMIYMMRYDGYMRYDLSRLLDYDWWYAGEYNGSYPKFFYNFQVWQYTSSGKVDGIQEKVDMDLWFIREPKQITQPFELDPVPEEPLPETPPEDSGQTPEQTQEHEQEQNPETAETPAPEAQAENAP